MGRPRTETASGTESDYLCSQRHDASAHVAWGERCASTAQPGDRISPGIEETRGSGRVCRLSTRTSWGCRTSASARYPERGQALVRSLVKRMRRALTRARDQRRQRNQDECSAFWLRQQPVLATEVFPALSNRYRFKSSNRSPFEQPLSTLIAILALSSSLMGADSTNCTPSAMRW